MLQIIPQIIDVNILYSILGSQLIPEGNYVFTLHSD